MYSTVLTIHSWVRWATLLLAVGATINAFRSVSLENPLPGRWWDSFFMFAIDIQVLFGLVLYFGLSPFTVQAMNDMGAAMKAPGLRFWAVDHAAGMFAAMVLVRMGRILAANAGTVASGRNRRLACFALATLVMVASIPWPGLANGRPLFRFS